MDKYDELKHNFKFLKKAYDLVKEDFPKLFRNSSDYTEEDEKNWDIALKKIDDNFITPEEQDFIEIWGDTDGTIGLIDYVYQNKNQFESFKESTNKYVKAFRESCRKLEEAPIGYIPGDEYRNDEKYEYTINDTAVSNLKKACEDLYKVSQIQLFKNNSSAIGMNDLNRDAMQTAMRCIDILNEFFEAYDIQPVYTNWVGGNKSHPTIHRNKEKSMDKSNYNI